MPYNMQKYWMISHMLENGIIDEIDAKIITLLIENARQTTQSIADKCNISRPTASERIKKLIERGIIDSFSAKLNYNRCNLHLRVFILVSFDATEGRDITQKEVAKLLSRINYVVNVDIVTGSHDFLVQVAIDDMHSLVDVIIEEMRAIKGVGNTQTLLSFAQYQYGKQIFRKMD